ncbi:MAG TPA: TMEM165/GDT1 family protein [Pseudonocardiaceae bacterium]|nr:TMEM165/GDT1 family protein [Pseudonocardiaceae bacterium]
MSLAALATVFGVVFIGELPDKTMFASLLLAARGRSVSVWLGVAMAFVVHVAIAVTVGGVLFTLLPHRLVQAVVALMFLVGAVMSFRAAGDEEEDSTDTGFRSAGGARTVGTAFLIIFIAEWGDLTQILTANLAARYADPLGVGVAAVAALWAVGGVAMVGGRLIRHLPVALVRRVTGVVLLVMAALAAFDALTGAATLV